MVVLLTSCPQASCLGVPLDKIIQPFDEWMNVLESEPDSRLYCRDPASLQAAAARH
jgi:hypothetical protein